MFQSHTYGVRIVHLTVGPGNPDDIKSILSSPLPILVYYTTHGDIADKAFERVTLQHHPYRVREISFRETSASFDEFFEVTETPLPYAGEP